MTTRVAAWLRWLRRKLSRTHWSARLLGIQPPPAGDNPGLILLQLDGLSRRQLEAALAAGRMPFVRRLIRRGHFTPGNFYSGIPSTTPAVQGEIFYGVKAAVPAFQFFDRNAGRVMHMLDADSAAPVESSLEDRCPSPLLRDGYSYSNIYRAGARRSWYCSRDLTAEEMLRKLHPLKSLILGIAYLPTILRIAGLALIELGLALYDAFRALPIPWHVFRREIAFVPARVLICIVVRELIRFRVRLDIERGAETIHANFLGYDEQAHRRGPGSAFAHWSLRGIDNTIRDIFLAAGRSHHRDYEIIVYSDHGQEHTVPYPDRCGRELQEALAEVFSHSSLGGCGVWMKGGLELIRRRPRRGQKFPSRPAAKRTSEPTPDPATHIIVTALGPLGHIYLPRRRSDAEMERLARELVLRARIPLVLYREATGTVRAWNSRGGWRLPADGEEVIGRPHPFGEEAAEDLAELCRHPDAGDFVISGWDPQQPPLTFAFEQGGHGGPGSQETHGFLLLPDRIRRWHLTHLEGTGRRVRGSDLRRIALHFLGRESPREERVPAHAPRANDSSLRVMTWNIHSCLGMDGKVRPERVARVINHCDPHIAAVQEVDAHRQRSGGQDQARRIAEHLRMEHVFHAMFEESVERYGIAIFSRFPFEVVRAGFLTSADPRRRREARGAIWIRFVSAGGTPVHLLNTHFGLGKEERRRQALELLGEGWLGAVPADEPVILCGDLNSRPNSLPFRLLSASLRDVQTTVPGHKPRRTFPSLTPVVRIDHILVSRHFAVESLTVPDTPTAIIASDHRAVCAELSLTDPA